MYDDKELNLCDNITLSMPSSVQGGSYFTKIHYAKRPLYMQTPKCISKQGISTIGKKMYIELVISNEKDTEFMSFDNEDAFVEEYDGRGAEFYYLFDHGVWYVKSYKGDFKPLHEELARLAKEAV